MQIKQKEVKLTLPQLVFSAAKQPKKYFEGGRGSGKSTLIGKRLRDIVNFLPKSSNALVGSTYTQILSRTLPSTVGGLEMFGLYQDVDFVVGTCGRKKGFAMPYEPPAGPMGWKNIIHFSNGTIFQLVSLDNPNSGRGLNSSTITGDEAALLDPERLYTNVKATNRVSKAALYNNHYLIGSESYFSSTPLTKSGKWFTEMEEKAKQYPNQYFFMKASSKSNPFIRAEWFTEMKEECPSELIYNAEILNIRPKEITDGFYANLTAKNYYTDHNNTYLESVGVSFNNQEHFNSNQDNDVRHNEPLIMSLDFGVFNCCVIQQPQGDVFRTLKSFWVKSPKLLADLIIEQFVPYYRPHQEKIILLYGGHDGNNRLPNSSLTLFEQVTELLIAHGWTVHTMSRGAAATHFDKYLLFNTALKGNDARLPTIAINESNNKDLIIALERTEAIEGTTSGVAKNKKDERNKKFQQEHATHLTDAWDIPYVTMYNQIFQNKDRYISEMQIKTN